MKQGVQTNFGDGCGTGQNFVGTPYSLSNNTFPVCLQSIYFLKVIESVSSNSCVDLSKSLNVSCPSLPNKGIGY